MGITVQFESYEEMIAFAGKLVGEKTPVEATKKETKVTKPVKEETPVQEEGTQRTEDLPVEEEGKTYTLEEVRASLAVLTRAGKQKQVKDLLTSFKAKNLTAVDPKDYAALMEKAGAL